jgi:acetolactate synthase-1/2/3 large subunit
LKKEKAASIMQGTKRIVVQRLLSIVYGRGGRLIYGYPGGAIMPLYDELYKFQDKLTHILTRHEQGATHAAQGYARVTEKLV